MASLAHVNIRTSKFEETVDFYERALGYRRSRAETRPDSALHAWMRDADDRPVIHIQQEDAPASGANAGSPLYHHVAFDCSDPQTWRDRLRAAAIPFDETSFAAAHMVQFNLRDPNGLQVELSFRDD